VVEAARESMTEARFAAEYEGVFASGADAMFPRHLLDRVTADVQVPAWDGLPAGAGLLGGVDWGATTDRSALAAVGRVRWPHGLFVVAVAHAWRSGHPLDGPGGVVGDLVDRAGAFDVLHAEANGLGLPVAQELGRRVEQRFARTVRRPRVRTVHTTGALKSAGYSGLRLAMERGRLILPAALTDLRRELLLLRVELTAAGGERIEAGAGHDDLPDALMLAAGPYRRGGEWRTTLADAIDATPLDESEEWAGVLPAVRTGGGVLVPAVPVLDAVEVPGTGAPRTVPSPFSNGHGFRRAVAQARRDAHRPPPPPPAPPVPEQPVEERVAGLIFTPTTTTNDRRI
jgi:hypothetical protein